MRARDSLSLDPRSAMPTANHWPWRPVPSCGAGLENGHPSFRDSSRERLRRSFLKVKQDRLGHGILWVPRTSSTSRDQAIFVDETADPISPLES